MCIQHPLQCSIAACVKNSDKLPSQRTVLSQMAESARHSRRAAAAAVYSHLSMLTPRKKGRTPFPSEKKPPIWATL